MSAQNSRQKNNLLPTFANDFGSSFLMCIINDLKINEITLDLKIKSNYHFFKDRVKGISKMKYVSRPY